MYVDQACPGCDRARTIAAEVERTLPQLTVTVVEIVGARAVPDSVVAVPAYVLDGQLLALGNPETSAIIEAAGRELVQEGEA